MNDPASTHSPLELGDEELAGYIAGLLERIIVHYSIWFSEVRHQLGMEKALAVLEEAGPRSLKIQLARLARTLGFALKNDLPAAMVDLPRESLVALVKSVSTNWLANDGVWFQAVEGTHGMTDAKRCNDSAWAQFSPYEAWTVRKFLRLPGRPGLEGLKKALGFRLYANVNVQSIVDESPESFLFYMNDCRVQSARRRKGLPDYACKSGGIVEYGYFARGIDDRIVTECIGCPPDPHTEGWYCAWRFSLPAAK